MSFVSKISWQWGQLGLFTGHSKYFHGKMFMRPINSSFLLKLLRQIMQVTNISCDVNSNVVFNFIMHVKDLLAVKTDKLLYLRFWVCS